MNSYKKYLFGLALSLFMFLALSSFASAQATNVSFPYWPDKTTPLLSCTGDYLDSSVAHCTSLCDIIYTFQRILYFIMTLILFVGAPLMFVIGGGMIFFAGANPSLLEQGKKVLWGAVIGVVLALSAYVIVGTFLWLIGNPNPPEDGQSNDIQRISWPNISCDPKGMPGGSLKLWDGSAKSGPLPGNNTPPPTGGGYGCEGTVAGKVIRRCSSSPSCSDIDCNGLGSCSRMSPCVPTGGGNPPGKNSGWGCVIGGKVVCQYPTDEHNCKNSGHSDCRNAGESCSMRSDCP